MLRAGALLITLRRRLLKTPTAASPVRAAEGNAYGFMGYGFLDTLRADQGRGSGRRYFIEYELWEGLNDSDADAARLVALLAGLPAHVNLIPHNPFPGNRLRPPTAGRVLAFQRLVHEAGVRCLVRWPRGSEIGAACGQLALR
jgi:adenine C2-methylase RlmN of 23S rRNA A2503 and tRNA A37